MAKKKANPKAKDSGKEKETKKKDEKQGKKKRDESPEYKWRNSEARQLLLEDILNGSVPLEDDGTMSAEEIFQQRPAFVQSGWRLFPGRLKALREQLSREYQRVEDDLEAFENYISNHKPVADSVRGYPQWEGSEAQKQLNKEIDEGTINDAVTGKRRKPSDVRDGHEAYLDFPLKVFADHIDQEIGTRKYYHTLKEKGKSQGKKLLKK